MDGTVRKEARARYQCHYNVRHPGECDGQSGYGMTKLDGVMEEIIRMKFAKMRAVSETELLTKQHEKEIDLAKAKHELAKADYESKCRELSDLRNETLKVIRGESRLSADLLNSLIDEVSAATKQADAALCQAKQELDACIETSANVKREYDKILNWADLYDSSTFDAKKMIVSQLIKAVRVRRDYEIEVDFNVSFEEFQSYRSGQPESFIIATDKALDEQNKDEQIKRDA